MNWEIYGYIVLGIVASVALPILWSAVRFYLPKPPGEHKAAAAVVWPAIRPYVLLGLASAVTAFLVYATGGEGLRSWQLAILAGYSWDSTLQRLAIR